MASNKKPTKGNWFRRLNFGAQLTIQLLPLVLIPTLIMGVVSFARARNLLREQAISQMTVATVEQIAYLDSWAKTRQDWLILRTGPGSLRNATSAVLSDPDNAELYQLLLDQIADTLEGRGTVLFSELMIARVEDGVVTNILASSKPTRTNTNPQILAGLPLDEVSMISIHNDPDFAPTSMAVLSSAPMRALSTDTVDTLVIGVNSGASLVSMMEQIQVFWQRKGIYQIESGRAFLVKQPDIAYVLPRYAYEIQIQTGVSLPPLEIYNPEEIQTQEYVSLEGEEVLGSFQWLPIWDAALVIELPIETAFGGLNTLTPFMIALLVITSLFVSILIPLFTNLSLRPLRELTRSVDKMAKGDLQQRVLFKRSDDLGRLADAFNQMAADLYTFYQSLEARVRERTRQIHTAAAIARDATADRPIEELMDETVWLITDRFQYYHAAIFLLDESGDFAVLRTASSAGGQRMLQNGYKLPVGKIGLVGYVTSTGEPRIAPDVSKDSSHFANPDLSETRSEIVIPLRRGKNILGALDVQSKELNAFSEEDILVLETMADQLSGAIENTKLIQDQTQLAEHRRQVLEVYQKLSNEQNFENLTRAIPRIVQETLGYQRVTLALNQFDQLVLNSSYPEPTDDNTYIFGSSPAMIGFLDQCLRTRAPIFLSSDDMAGYLIKPSTKQQKSSSAPSDGFLSDALSEQRSAQQLPSLLSFPLQSGGKVLGVLAIEREESTAPNPEEADIFELLAGQISAILQNALLLEETQESLNQVQVLYRQQTREAWADLLGSRAQTPNMASYQPDPGQSLDENAKMFSSPLQLRGETIGSLLLGNKKGDSWDSDDIDLIESIADEIAGAVEQQRLLVEIHRRAAELQIAAEIARDATGLLDLNTLMQRAVQLIRQRFGFYHVGIYLRQSETDLISLQASASDTFDQIDPRSVNTSADEDTILGQVIARGESYLAHDIHQESLFQPIPGLPDTASQVVIPLHIGSQIFGALDVHSNRAHTFQEADITVLEILADQISVAIQNARTYEEAVQRAEREETAVQFSRTIRASADLDGLIQEALSFIQKTIGTERATIHLLQPDTHDGGMENTAPSEKEQQAEQPTTGRDKP
ncbi:MAG: GAF domain-containing protein [Anaerolineales bacterium]|nr:GAF domain-containing protein [Anaerolineales bacterium]